MLARLVPLLRTVGRFGEEILPGTVASIEKKGGDDEQAGDMNGSNGRTSTQDSKAMPMCDREV